MIDPLLRQIGQNSKLCAYADDLLILVEGQSRAELEGNGEQAMRKVCEWGYSVGVAFLPPSLAATLLVATKSDRKLNSGIIFGGCVLYPKRGYN